jgi:hypothetical protein
MNRLLQLLTILSLSLFASAQFGFFEQMFGGQQGHHHQQQQQQQNVASDSTWYKQNYEAGKSPPLKAAHSHCVQLTLGGTAPCSHYLCPGTLSCVHFPHHCPCAFPDIEDKIELGEGSMLCASKGGWKSDQTLKKIELARKGVL